MSERQVVSSQDMRQLDKLTMTTNNITSYQLMEQAAKGLTRYLLDQILDDISGLFVIVSGLGNNGGDALLIGRELYQLGVKVSIVLVGAEDHQSDDSLQAINECQTLDMPMMRVASEEDFSLALEIIESANVIIDGLFGIGLSRNIEGIFESIVLAVNHSYGTVISIDIPSGIHADNGLVMGCAIRANHTLIVQKYKQGNILNDALDYNGVTHVVDVGIMDKVQEDRQELISSSFLYTNFPKRMHNSYKYVYGNVLT
ncbi:MAG: NAD(P)H-hydrate epimerase, partial [Halieaceae bacterium]|nr:NAD(P)H-hydrate epimerase [Halieaceae bacterium]